MIRSILSGHRKNGNLFHKSIHIEHNSEWITKQALKNLTESYVGSLARFRKRQTLSIEPFSSKSDLKKRAVSMLT